jgi:hypothetical protein
LTARTVPRDAEDGVEQVTQRCQLHGSAIGHIHDEVIEDLLGGVPWHGVVHVFQLDGAPTHVLFVWTYECVCGPSGSSPFWIRIGRPRARRDSLGDTGVRLVVPHEVAHYDWAMGHRPDLAAVRLQALMQATRLLAVRMPFTDTVQPLSRATSFVAIPPLRPRLMLAGA